jgi:hypothetical protein
MKINILEQSVIKKLLMDDGINTVFLKNLEDQIPFLEVNKREFTGVGFFTYFNLKKGVISSNVERKVFGDVGAEIEHMELGLSFLLYIENGFISCLECHTFGEVFPSKINNFNLFYYNSPRKIDF